MDLGLKELGITLMVGAFFILGLEAIMHYFFNTQLTGFFQDVLKSRAVSRATHADEQIGTRTLRRREAISKKNIRRVLSSL